MLAYLYIQVDLFFTDTNSSGIAQPLIVSEHRQRGCDTDGDPGRRITYVSARVVTVMLESQLPKYHHQAEWYDGCGTILADTESSDLPSFLAGKGEDSSGSNLLAVRKYTMNMKTTNILRTFLTMVMLILIYICTGSFLINELGIVLPGFRHAGTAISRLVDNDVCRTILYIILPVLCLAFILIPHIIRHIGVKKRTGQ